MGVLAKTLWSYRLHVKLPTHIAIKKDRKCCQLPMWLHSGGLVANSFTQTEHSSYVRLTTTCTMNEMGFDGFHRGRGAF